jgi:hypothetical protein
MALGKSEAGQSEVASGREAKVWIGIVVPDSCEVAAPNAKQYMVKHSSASDTAFVKVETVQYSGGSSWNPEVFIHFVNIKSSAGNPPETIEEILDLSEFPKEIVHGKTCYAVGHGSEKKASVHPVPVNTKVRYEILFRILTRRPCCPPTDFGATTLNVTGTVIIGPDGLWGDPRYR